MPWWFYVTAYLAAGGLTANAAKWVLMREDEELDDMAAHFLLFVALLWPVFLLAALVLGLGCLLIPGFWHALKKDFS